jgi:tripartite ATP-independent transporter DctP family solute receptor
MKKSIIYLSAILIMVLGFTMGLHAEKAEFELKFGTDVPGDDAPYNKSANFFGKRIKELTDGRVNVTLYSAGSLGDELTMIDSLSLGDLDLAIIAVPNLSQHAPRLNFFSLSYLFKDADHFVRAITDKAFLQEVQNIISEKDLGFKPLSLLTPGQRNFYTNKGELRTPEELKGLDVRVMAAPLEARIWKMLGTNPVSISSGECYTALQTGLIDACEHEIGSYYSRSTWEQAKYYSNTGHQWTTCALLISDMTWNKFPQDIKDAFTKAAKEFAEYEVDYCINTFEAWIREELKDKVTFYEVDKEAFRKVLLPLQDEVAKEFNAVKLLERIRELENQ